MKTIELDEIDKKLLMILQENAKTPYSKISGILGVSEATVHLRIKKLLKLKDYYEYIAFPEMGLGTGLAQMNTKSPILFKRLENTVTKLIKDTEDYNLFDIEEFENKIIIFSRSHESPTNNIQLVEETLSKLNYNGEIIFDLLLSVGNSFNRYILATFKNNKINRKSYKILEDVPMKLRELSRNYYKNNII